MPRPAPDPRRPLEASGTSGQKVVLNGGLNLSVLDGWWAEAFDGVNGFAIGTGKIQDRRLRGRRSPVYARHAAERRSRHGRGYPVAALVPAGGYLTGGALAQHDPRDDRGDAPLAPGERSLDVAVAGGAALATAVPGTRVDVLVTTDPSSGGGRTFLALEDVELLAVRPGGGGGDAAAGGAASHATAVATLRVTLRQAVFLTAAESFAREIRLLVRAPGDRSSAPPLAVGGRALR